MGLKRVQNSKVTRRVVSAADKSASRGPLKVLLLVALVLFIPALATAGAENTRTSIKSSPAVTEKKQGPRRNSDIQVVMYVTSWCTYCKKAAKYIRSLGVNLIEYDIEKNASREKEMKRLSGGSSMVPLIYIEGTIIRGYVPEEIKAAVEKRKKQ